LVFLSANVEDSVICMPALLQLQSCHSPRYSLYKFFRALGLLVVALFTRHHVEIFVVRSAMSNIFHLILAEELHLEKAG
jgi:hypothetical protein